MEGRLLRPGWAVKAIVVILITSILFRCVSAANHPVGGSSGWDLASNLQVWSSSTTFHVGDSLVFTYTPLHDVLEVNKFDFDKCHIAHPIKAYRDGETVIKLMEVGNRYFICGRLGHCDLGLKLRVQILQNKQPTNNATAPDSGAEQGRGRGRDHGRHSPSPPAAAAATAPAPGPAPPSRSREKPEPLDMPAAPVANSPSNDASGGGGHLEVNWGFLPLITLLVISYSYWPRETLPRLFLLTFSHLLIS